MPDDDNKLSADNSQSVKYKAALVGKTINVAGGNSFVKTTKIVGPLEWLCNFLRSLEMQLINCKVHVELNWIEDYIISSAEHSAKFNMMDAEFMFL